MSLPAPTLTGNIVRLEPLRIEHAEAMAEAGAIDRSYYDWSFIPASVDEARQYIETALKWRDEGTAIPFATFRQSDGRLIGSTRFFLIEYWTWPSDHPRYGRSLPDACEIGYTWLTAPAIRSGANTEAKLLMLTYAFEVWNVLRVCFHTDARNARSRAALERIGANFEGILRSHRLAVDATPRDSARFSIVAEEWPDVREGLNMLLER